MNKTQCNIHITDPRLLNESGIIRNSEISDKIFARVQDDYFEFFSWPEKNTKLNFGIYIDAYVSPLVCHSSGAYGEETCFENIFAFSPSKYFDYKNNLKWEIDQDLDYKTFCSLLYDEIDRTIDEVYKKYNTVTLFYSGGIDSQVLLSFLIKKDLLDRTYFVTAHNIDLSPQFQINTDPEKRDKIDKLFAWLKPRCAGIEEVEFSISALLDTINHGTLYQLKSFSTYLMFKRYRNRALMFGLQGNNVLIHRSTYAGQIMLHDSNRLWPDFSQNKNLYTTAILKYNYKKDNVLYKDRFIVKKNYHKLSGINGNELIVPIGTDNTFNLVRRVNWRTFDLEVISDALIPRLFIYKNTGTFMDQFIVVENTVNWDSLDFMEIPVESLNLQATYIPMDIEHDERGLSYIHHHLENAKITGTIPLPVLVSIKSLQMISDRFKDDQ